MLCCRIFLAASLFVLLVVPNSLAGAALQKQPPASRRVSSEVRAACDWYKVAVLCTSPEFPENRWVRPPL